MSILAFSLVHFLCLKESVEFSQEHKYEAKRYFMYVFAPFIGAGLYHRLLGFLLLFAAKVLQMFGLCKL